MVKTRNTNAIKGRLSILVVLTVLLLLVQIVNSFTNYSLNSWGGIYPRHTSGLIGIIVAPFLHGSWSHLFSNLLPLLILSVLAMINSVQEYLKASLFIMIMGGILVWLFGRSALHVGASGWIFGLWAWLLLRAIFQHNLTNLLIATGVFILYGGLWLGFLPKTGVSFEGHIAGAFSGVFFAYISRNQRIKKTTL